MHVVLSGYFGFNNEGDEAILQSIIQSLRSLDKTVTITVLSNNPKQTADKYHVQVVNRWKIGEIRRTLHQADGLISGGGSLLQDKTSLKTIPYYTTVMHLARLSKTPVFIYSQGMGPIDHVISKGLTRFTLNRVQQITVRDEASKTLLQSLNVKKDITIVPDAVFGLEPVLKTSDWLKEEMLSNYLVVSVRPWPNSDSFYKLLAETLDDLPHDIVFMPMHGEDDEKQALVVSNMMTKRVHHVPAETSLEEKLAILSSAKLLIGMRLHALIFSSIVDTPFVACSYDPKIDAIAKQLKQPRLLEVTKPETFNTFKDDVKEALANADEAQLALVTSVDQFKQAAQLTTKEALQLFREN